jgi:peptidoglycan/LPS O-acetylase OafA/YrhL
MQPISERSPRQAAFFSRIPELDGLRALLAWWVVVYHARGDTFSAAFAFTSGPLSFLSQGMLAVDAFMILSGFVIFFLLERERESYGVFVARRFLRLFPAYAVCFALMLFLQGAYIDNLHALRPQLTQEAYAAMLRHAEEPLRELPAQLLVHAVMLHGPIPDAWLHNSAGAFLMPAWSVSLEWQFYLVAPLAFWLIRRGGRPGIVLCVLATALAYATRAMWPPMRFSAFLPIHLPLFALGIASYYGLRWAARQSGPRRAALAWAPLATLAGIAGFLVLNSMRLGANALLPGRWLPVSIWAFVLACTVAQLSAAPGALARAVSHALRRPPLRFLGEISYSTYLVHWPVLVALTALLRRSIELTPTLHFVLLLVVGAPLVAAASWALHRYVERPGIALGRRWSSRLEGQRERRATRAT